MRREPLETNQKLRKNFSRYTFTDLVATIIVLSRHPYDSFRVAMM